MIKRTEVLTRSKHDIVWGYDHGTYPTYFACASGMNRAWILDDFKEIRIAVSNKSIQGAIRIRCDDRGSFNSYTGIGIRSFDTLEFGFKHWIKNNFSAKTKFVWVWIEEA